MKKRYHFLLPAGVVFIALILIGTGCSVSSGNSSIPTEEKKQVTAQASWKYYSFEDAVNAAETIVYGRAGQKGETKKFDGAADDSVINYYRKVPIEVLKLIKGQAPNSGTVDAIEPGGETADTCYIMEGAKLFEKDKEYIIFMNHLGAALAPYAVLDVTDGVVETNGLIPGIDWTVDTDYPKTMPVDDYLNLIEKALEENK